nr:thioredoxin domain containing protein 2 [Hymenolepis microstoma]
MAPKRTSRRSSVSIQNHLQYASTKEECHHILNTQAKKLVVFIFTAEWCPHSVQLKAHLETLAKEDQHVVLTLIDIDNDEDLVQFYSLYAVPTYYFFKNQEEIGIQVGDVRKHIVGADFLSKFRLLVNLADSGLYDNVISLQVVYSTAHNLCWPEYPLPAINPFADILSEFSSIFRVQTET